MSGYFINVDRDGWTGGLQLSLDTPTGGYRLAGPKFNGSSESLLRFALTSERDISEIEQHCRAARAALALKEQAQ